MCFAYAMRLRTIESTVNPAHTQKRIMPRNILPTECLSEANPKNDLNANIPEHVPKIGQIHQYAEIKAITSIEAFPPKPIIESIS